MHRTLLAAALTFALGAPAAHADIAPPPGYVEQCTVGKQQKPGEECTLCSGAYHRDPDYCVRTYQGQGLSRRCRTRGASVWKEVWCRKAGGPPIGPIPGAPEPAPTEPEPAPTEPEPAPTEPAPTEPEPAPDKPAPSGGGGEASSNPASPVQTSGCAASDTPAGAWPLALALALAALTLARRRRA